MMISSKAPTGNQLTLWETQATGKNRDSALSGFVGCPVDGSLARGSKPESPKPLNQTPRFWKRLHVQINVRPPDGTFRLASKAPGYVKGC